MAPPRTAVEDSPQSALSTDSGESFGRSTFRDPRRSVWATSVAARSTNAEVRSRNDEVRSADHPRRAASERSGRGSNWALKKRLFRSASPRFVGASLPAILVMSFNNVLTAFFYCTYTVVMVIWPVSSSI